VLSSAFDGVDSWYAFFIAATATTSGEDYSKWFLILPSPSSKS
jgi:hypothetical protein